MTFSLIITSNNRMRVPENLLFRLEEQTDKDIEVIDAMDGCTDRILAMLESSRLSYPLHWIDTGCKAMDSRWRATQAFLRRAMVLWLLLTTTVFRCLDSLPPIVLQWRRIASLVGLVIRMIPAVILDWLAKWPLSGNYLPSHRCRSTKSEKPIRWRGL